MKNILMVAFSCQPDKGSEPGVGWNWAIQAARTQNVYLLTRTKMKLYIEPSIPNDVRNSLHFIYAPSSSKLRKISIYLEYIDWQKSALRKAKEVQRYIKFDFVWHLTWGNMFLPSYMYKLKIPFIWGPVGGDGAPKQFFSQFTKKKQIIHNIKYYMGKHAEDFWWIKKMADSAAIIIARTEETKKMFSLENQKKIVIRLEACVDVENSFSFPPATESIIHKGVGKNLIYTGRLTDFKNVPLLLYGMSNILNDFPTVKLHILGDGDELSRCEELSKQLKLQDNVEFYGFVNRMEMLKALKECDYYVFPSLREGASWSLLEAMAYKKPILALDLNGIHDTLIDSGAFLVDVAESDYNQLINKFSSELKKMLFLSQEDSRRIGILEYKKLSLEFSCDGVKSFVADLVSYSDMNELRKTF